MVLWPYSHLLRTHFYLKTIDYTQRFWVSIASPRRTSTLSLYLFSQLFLSLLCTINEITHSNQYKSLAGIWSILFKMLHFCPQFPLWHLKGQTRNSFIWSPPTTVLYIWLCYCKFTVTVIAIQVFIRQSNLFMGGYLKRKNKPRGQNWLVGGGVIPCVARKFSAAILWIWISLFSSTDIRINYPKRLPLLSIAHWHLKLMAYRQSCIADQTWSWVRR